MAITANIGLQASSLPVGDTTVIDPSATSATREGVQNAVVHNTGGSPITLNVSENAILLTSYSIAANSTQVVDEIIGQGFESGQTVVFNASAAGLNYKITVTRTTP